MVVLLDARIKYKVTGRGGMVIWAIWRARNELLWNQKVTATTRVIMLAKMVLDQWKFSQSHKFDSLLDPLNSSSFNEHWTKPVTDTININADGALFAEEGKFGFAGVDQDSDGRLVEAFSCFHVGRVSPEIAEVLSVKEALSWIKDKQCHRVVIETDYLLVVQAIQSSVAIPSAFGLIIQDCKQIMVELNISCLHFVKCSSNKVSHSLAMASCYVVDRRFSASSTLPALMSYVMDDLLKY